MIRTILALSLLVGCMSPAEPHESAAEQQLTTPVIGLPVLYQYDSTHTYAGYVSGLNSDSQNLIVFAHNDNAENWPFGPSSQAAFPTMQVVGTIEGATDNRWQVNPAGLGPQGPSGTAGATGPQGPAGSTGATGSTGPQGTIGLTGATGAGGATGPQGTAGATGSAGASGSTGATGPAGPGSLVTGSSTPTLTIGGTAVQFDATHDTIYTVSVKITTSISLTGGAAGHVDLVCDATTTPTAIVETVQSESTGTLTVGLALQTSNTLVMQWRAPAGHRCKLVSTNDTGTPTYSITRQTLQTLG